MRSLFFWFVLLSLLIGGGWLLVQYPRSQAPIVFFVEKGTISAADPNGLYTIDIEYPKISGLPMDKQVKINSEIVRDIDVLATAFKQDAGDTTGGRAGEKSDMTVRYDVVYQDPHIVSIRFDVLLYSAGAAHPNLITSTLSYDLDSGTAIRLADIFKHGVDPYRILSELSKKELLKDKEFRGTSEMLLSGTAPKESNFKSYLLTGTGIKVIFDPYQVAPYSAGPQEVSIAYSVLRDQLSDESPISHLFKTQ